MDSTQLYTRMPAKATMNFPKAFHCYVPRHHRIYGAVCISPMNRILVVKGRRSGKWSFPKGHMENSENSLDCALRELQEETGVDLSGATPMSCRKLSVGSYFFFEVDEEEEPTPRDLCEVEEAAWIPVDRLPQMDCNVDVNAFLDRLARSQRRAVQPLSPIVA